MGGRDEVAGDHGDGEKGDDERQYGMVGVLMMGVANDYTPEIEDYF